VGCEFESRRPFIKISSNLPRIVKKRKSG
jgi:hypothetical protein